MGYIEENLTPGEQIIYRAKLHWAIFFTPVILIFLGLLLTLISFVGNQDNSACLCFGIPVILLGVLAGISSAVSVFSSEFALTDKRVIAKIGFLRRQSAELLLTKVESVGVDQPILGRMLGYGTITLTGSGGTKENFKNISNPMELRRQVQHRIADL